MFLLLHKNHKEELILIVGSKFIVSCNGIITSFFSGLLTLTVAFVPDRYT
jgi:hypothetical protein